MANKLPTARNVTVSGLEDSLATIKLGSINGYILTSLPSNGTIYLDPEHTIPAQMNKIYASKTFYFLPDADVGGIAAFA